ncbi:DUF3833 family protein [Aureimonas populi]|uniref:DUF3833 family protein n=1 Tax=Aureimonas populi TaxID=1701758 RepID=A0ABW5CPI5_9HYPH|nr:DUF3833 family protein [Aureimonas populi]
MRRIALLFLLALALGGGALAFAQGYGGGSATRGGGFDLFAFFEGSSASRGTITTALVRREAFTATFEGRRQGDGFRLEERFAFEDGGRLQVWTLAQAGQAVSGTVETELETGEMSEPATVSGMSGEDGVVLSYEGYAPGGGGLLLHFRHHMRAMGDGTVLNRVVVSKFGLPLATSSVIFARQAAALPSLSRGR